MINYNSELDLIFEEWENGSKKNGDLGFCQDGLMYKGKIGQSESGHWYRTRGNENEQWHNSSKRVLFLMKDPNGNPGTDMREWIGRQHPTTVTSMFFKSISLWLLGLNSFNEKSEYLSFENAIEPEAYSHAFDTLPISIVNIKKESGKGTVSNRELWSYITKSEKYSELLKKQIEILNPNIIVCGGGSGTVFKIALDLIYSELEFKKINNWIYYNKGEKIVLIDSYHPAQT